MEQSWSLSLLLHTSANIAQQETTLLVYLFSRIIVIIIIMHHYYCCYYAVDKRMGDKIEQHRAQSVTYAV